MSGVSWFAVGCRLLLLGVVACVATGCAGRLPSGEPSQGIDLRTLRGPAPKSDGETTERQAMPLEPLQAQQGATQWMSMNEPLPAPADSDAGQNGDVRERRWDDVAVHFAYDRATIGQAERQKLEVLADFLADHPSYKVVIEGHADRRGSDEYNRGLSERRALAVKQYLIDLGVDAARLQTIAYGEDKPAVPGATTESEHAQNRRVEFVFRMPAR